MYDWKIVTEYGQFEVRAKSPMTAIAEAKKELLKSGINLNQEVKSLLLIRGGIIDG